MMTDIQYFFGEKMPSDEYIRDVAMTKRFLEYWTMCPGFKEDLEADRVKALAAAGIELSEPETADYLVNEDKARKYLEMKPESRPEMVRRYKSFIQEKLTMRDELQVSTCEPVPAGFKKWRRRQVNRCWTELGVRNRSIIHTPIIFELNKGCSVGCEFCGVSAGRLSKVSKYSEEKELWRAMLSYIKERLGAPAASSGTLYYACEPLDNPDYQQFSDDYFDILGEVGQVTTAASTRNVERTRSLLKHMLAQKKHVHRFSVLSLEMFKTLMREFTPEELVYVELLPQFPEAPACRFARAGRASDYEHQDKVGDLDGGDTISCISGFVVNVAEHTIRLISPCVASEKEPTGERFIARTSFTDFESFKNELNRLMDEYMAEDIDNNKRLVLRPGIKINPIENGIQYHRGQELILTLKDGDGEQPGIHQQVYEALKPGSLTGYEIAAELMDKGYAPANVFRIIKEYYGAGLILEPYEHSMLQMEGQ